MTSGGPRPGTGSKPDPRSASAERRGTGTLLPAEGYRGPVPDFPMPEPMPRDLELWRWAWSTPQAAAWAREPWRQYAVAQWCQVARACERPNPTAADRSGVNGLADRIGLSEAGLRFNGWTISAGESDPRAERATETPTRSSSRARMTILSDDDSGDAASRSA